MTPYILRNIHDTTIKWSRSILGFNGKSQIYPPPKRKLRHPLDPTDRWIHQFAGHGSTIDYRNSWERSGAPRSVAFVWKTGQPTPMGPYLDGPPVGRWLTTSRKISPQKVGSFPFQMDVLWLITGVILITYTLLTINGMILQVRYPPETKGLIAGNSMKRSQWWGHRGRPSQWICWINFCWWVFLWYQVGGLVDFCKVLFGFWVNVLWKTWPGCFLFI